MSAKQYAVLLDLYNEWNEAFRELGHETQAMFFEVLYGRVKFNLDTGRYE